MKKYLFDTNICIYYIRGFYDLNTKFNAVKEEDRYISEITLAELKFGVENSEFPRKNKKVLDNFLTGLQVLPIYFSLDLYAKEKARLRKQGKPIDDFIGVSAVVNNMVLVTNNESHFKRIQNIQVENWTKTD